MHTALNENFSTIHQCAIGQNQRELTCLRKILSYLVLPDETILKQDLIVNHIIY